MTCNCKRLFALLLVFALLFSFASCGSNPDVPPVDEDTSGEIQDENNVPAIPDPVKPSCDHTFSFTSQSGENFLFTCTKCKETETVCTSYVSGTRNAVRAEGNTLIFGVVSEDSVYAVWGTFQGNVKVEAGKNGCLELELRGLTLTSYDACPLTVTSADSFTLSAKKASDNYIYDMREKLSATASDPSAAVYVTSDFDLKGKGNLFVKSQNNNGVQSKKDLTVKNLSLQIDCQNNALKGNNSVTVESGSTVLIARSGDGIKTSNTDASSKGNQKGYVRITGGNLLIYAASDGIDAAYDVEINENDALCDVQIFTDVFSKYSAEMTAFDEQTVYVCFPSQTYQYAMKFFTDEATDAVWQTAAEPIWGGMSYYYPISRPTGSYAYVKLYAYNSTQTPGTETCAANTEPINLNADYDTLTLTVEKGNLRYGWTNYTAKTADGTVLSSSVNTADRSSKGIKSDAEIRLLAGTVLIRSYDDALHASNDETMDSGAIPTGNITLSGGSLTVGSNDDAIHADGILTVSGGAVTVSRSHEGMEAEEVRISGGNVAIYAGDDGINACKNGGTPLTISGGQLFISSTGDALDSNSDTKDAGIAFTGGRCVLISTGRLDTSVDTEKGFSYTAGWVLAIQASDVASLTSLSGFDTVGATAALSAAKGQYICVADTVSVKMRADMQANVVILGAKTQPTLAASLGTEDANGVCWLAK